MNALRAGSMLLTLAVGCAGLSWTESEQRPAPSRAPADPSRVDRPRLVVVAVFDQLGASTLAELSPLLDEDGAIRTAKAHGTEHTVLYPYAATYTAPGHATLHTGAAPRESGIVANERWIAARGEVSWLDDPSSPVLGDPSTGVSPRALRIPTVADALKAATAGRGKVVSVSVKDRAAMIPGGRTPDLAVWYSAKARGFTTSRYYGEDLPGCASRHAAANPIDSLLTPWVADPRVAEARTDDANGEGRYLGWARAFPHDPRTSSDPWRVLRLTPALTEYSLALAGSCATDLGLGTDDVPDLLAVSLSSTDYAGHVFGPESREYADALVRTDRALGRLLRALEARARISVLISSDHGVTPTPERAGRGGRIVPMALIAKLERALDERLGRGDYVAAFVAPFVVLTESARKRPDVLPVLLSLLGEHEGIAAAFDARDGSRLRSSNEPLERAVGLSLDREPPGDAFVVPEDGWAIDPDMAANAGTSHGSPWRHDSEVPVLFWGPGVARTRGHEVLDARRVAPTIAALLGVPPPASAREPELPGAPARCAGSAHEVVVNR